MTGVVRLAAFLCCSPLVQFCINQLDLLQANLSLGLLPLLSPAALLMGSLRLALPPGAAAPRCVRADVFHGASTIVFKMCSHIANTASTLCLQMPTGAPGAGGSQLSTPEGRAMESGASQGQESRTKMAGLAISSPVAGQ